MLETVCKLTIQLLNQIKFYPPMDIYINSFGSSLSRDKGLFRIKTAKRTVRLSPERVKCILVSRGCSITSDALLMAIEYEIPVILMKSTGQPAGRMASHKFGSIATIRRQQVVQAKSPAMARWLIEHLKMKTQRQIEHLAWLQSQTRQPVGTAIETMERIATQFDSLSITTLEGAAPTIMGVEGSLSRIYFPAISSCLPKRYQFATRSRMPAHDPFNAVLNYLYGMLYNRIETALVKAGLDPYLPVLHRDEYDRPGFVYDFIEAYRPWADQVATTLFIGKRIKTEKHFRQTEGGMWLNDVGKEIVIPACHDSFEVKIAHQKSLSRKNRIIELDTQAFASTVQTLLAS
jgi:CRISP-associated protein Cas1